MRSISPSWVSTRSSSDLFQSLSWSVCSCSLSACWLHDGVGRLQLAALVVHFGEQPRIAHRQHRLVRKGLHQPDQVGGEFAGVLPQHHQRAQNAGLVDQRHHQHRVEAGFDRDVAQRMIGAPRRDRGSRSARPSLAASPSGELSASMARWPPSADLVDADRFGEVELAVAGVIAVDQHGVGMGDFQRARGDRRQHGVEVERGGDRAADLLEHLQLVDRLRQVARPLLHLGFEVGIGLGELRRPCR